MKNYFFSSLFLLTFAYAQSSVIVGSGKIEKQISQLGSFSKIHADTTFDIIIEKANKSEYTIQSDDNILKIISLKVKGDTLYIVSTKSYETQYGIKLNIKTKELNGLYLDGTSSVKLKQLNENKLTIRLDGSCDVTSLKGRVDTLHIEADGAYDIDLKQLSVNNAIVNISGSGDVRLNVLKKINANISDNGSVLYSGTAVVTSRILDNGDIEKE